LLIHEPLVQPDYGASSFEVNFNHGSIAHRFGLDNATTPSRNNTGNLQQRYVRLASSQNGTGKVSFPQIVGKSENTIQIQ
jgi:hypothetical protein